MNRPSRWGWMVLAAMVVVVTAPVRAPRAGEGMTALAAYRLAAPLAARWKPEPVLMGMDSDEVPLAAVGLIRTTTWFLAFNALPGGKLTVWVEEGSARAGASDTSGDERHATYTRERGVHDPGSLIDSDRVVSIAEQQGGREARARGATTAKVSLRGHWQDVRWIVNYTGADLGVKYSVHVDARSGKVLHFGGLR